MSLDFFLILILFVLYFKKKLLFLQRSREGRQADEAMSGPDAAKVKASVYNYIIEPFKIKQND